ncbi:hypothetical protein I0P70_12645 [Pontibacter sp. FD36]|uniref:hypothetical protein n=1 Tax=Pontibacter sp. FD36 TaxID=2789860 RepID=UPI0018A9B9F3|nr:hypothetical protein [Pontibacter sp. FD36]MBF8964096.1 hypothetical protein [Pontibacter sp. FD36]
MRRVLTDWRVYLLFIPGILGIVILEFSLFDAGNHRQSFSIANMLWVINLLLIVTVQAYLTTSFDKATLNKIGLPTLNAFLPVFYFALYFLFVISKAVTTPASPAAATLGPVRSVNLGLFNTVIFILLLYSAISFLFLNNWLVKRRILRNQDSVVRMELAKNYLVPMKRLVKAAVVVVVGTFLFWVFFDIIRLTI